MGLCPEGKEILSPSMRLWPFHLGQSPLSLTIGGLRTSYGRRTHLPTGGGFPAPLLHFLLKTSDGVNRNTF